MITGVGTDIIEVERVAGALTKFGMRFRNRIFTPGEQEFCEAFKLPNERYAARWAAKEAAVKALGTGFTQGIRWVDVEVVANELGQPLIRLAGRASEIAREQGVRSAHVSLSHNRSLATAVVVLATTPVEGAFARFDPHLVATS